MDLKMLFIADYLQGPPSSARPPGYTEMAMKSRSSANSTCTCAARKGRGCWPVFLVIHRCRRHRIRG
ncbi:hypothetical protein CBP05_02010 [Pseudomonas putida]|nr:hypothetical protein CBP06_18450 [Pseudomonas putida]OUS87706.1 hypothetical protein CBP05_02010 [Pseudomonas putida]